MSAAQGEATEPEPQEGRRGIYMVLVGPSGSVFVKEGSFFRDQGGFDQAWGNHWRPVVALGVEHARELACKDRGRFPEARPYDQQCCPNLIKEPGDPVVPESVRT